MTEASIVLSAVSLSKSFGSTLAVSGITVTISSNEVVALAGGNGSGKTTLLKMIAGTLIPDSGYLALDGRRLTPGNPHSRRLEGIEMVYQDCALCPDCSVLENLFLGREIITKLGFLNLTDMRHQARAMIAHYGFAIPNLRIATKYLSGGQQKAVAIGRSLLSGPRVLLLDEPTASLGVKEQDTILGTLGELRSSGGVVFCTHSPRDILAVADRVLVLRVGELVHDRSLQGVSETELAIMMSS